MRVLEKKSKMQSLRAFQTFKLLLFLVFITLTLPSLSLAATTVTKTSEGIEGGFYVITLSVVADGSGGAVTETISLTKLLNKGAFYFYMLHEVPGTGTAEPSAHTNVFSDIFSGTVLNAAGATTANSYVNAAEDLPNYWPATGNLSLTVSDIGASNSTVLRLLFCPN